MKTKVVDIKGGWWYITFIDECPICGIVEIKKERQYTEKPSDPSERFVYNQRYDYCMER